ncbi:hypothetical protein FGO68_gene14823 [Halteria grandinella]|uniref:Uncharacterized protein n=1 Tax=Halteria grandinella TaxID=5974 RepID=A0A8J8T2H3_HALGN|nr:hypothetical protein FGO68_gene14823 [Halteria grandinella]
MHYANFASPRRLLALTFLGVVLFSESVFLSQSVESELTALEESSLETSHLSTSSFAADPFKLEQTTKVYTTAIDEVFDLFDRFLEGFRATVFSPNAMKCSQRVRSTALTFNSTLVNYGTAKNQSVDRYVFNFTKVISVQGADAVGECYTTGFNVYSYVLMRATQFTDFTSVITAFLQNLIGNILNFNTIYQNIVNANTAGKYSDVYFYIGRLSYLILYFDPMVDSSLESPVQDPIEFLLKQDGKLSLYTKITDVAGSFLNASIGSVSPNSSVCVGNLSYFNDSISLLVSQYELKLYDKMGTTFKRMVQAVDPITSACFYSGAEYLNVLLDYLVTLIDINKLTYNLFHNMGRIYDATTDLISIFRFGDPNTNKYWRGIGKDIGLIINQISYKPSNYDPYNTTKKVVQAEQYVLY